MDVFNPDGLHFTYDLYNNIGQSELNYTYCGGFSFSITNRILSLAEANLDKIGETEIIKKKVYFIMVKSLHHVTRQFDKFNKEEAEPSSFFTIQKVHDNYFITFGMLVESKIMESIRKKLEEVNTKDTDKLIKQYKEIVKKGEITDKAGIGMGVLEMAQKSGNNLAFEFKKMNEEYSWLYIQTAILKKSNESEAVMNSGEELKKALNFHHILMEKNMNLVYSGYFNQDTVRNILSMTEGNTGWNKGLIQKKNIFNIIIELMQNINKYGYDPEKRMEDKSGIFLIGRDETQIAITMGNLVLNDNIVKLKSTLDQINSLNFAELDNLYNQVMMEDEQEGATGAGLGLIDIKMKSKNKLEYDFIPVKDNYSFYCIQVRVSDN